MSDIAGELDHRGRITRLVEVLQSQGLDGYLMTQPANLRYFTGTTVRTGVLLVARSASPRLLIREQNANGVGPVVEGCEVVLLQGGGGWEAAAIADLRNRLPDLTVCDDLALSLATSLHDVAPSALLSPRPDVAASLRRKKDASEEMLLRQASAIADEAAAAAFAVLGAGISELAVVAEIESALRRAGADGTRFPTRFGSGSRSADPDVEPSRRLIEPGDLGLFDIGPIYEGYLGDISRGFVVGEPSAEQAHIAGLAIEALNRVEDRLRPGVSAADLCAVAHETFDRAGLARAFRHHLGHGLGLTMDPPLIRAGSSDRLEEGDFIALEPGLYLPGLGGVRFENNYRVGPDGPELLSHFPLSFRVDPAT